MPPSTDPPGSAGKTGSGKPRFKSERKRGGQRGHRGTRRQLVPEAQVNEIINLYPAECENCWTALPEVADPNAKRYQGQTTGAIPPIPKMRGRREEESSVVDRGLTSEKSADELILAYLSEDADDE